MGSFQNKNKDYIEFYKNWIHIGSPSTWKDGGSFVQPIIARMTEGYMEICRFEITAKRGPQNGIFVFASRYDETCKKNEYRRLYFGGIGCSGYVDHVEEVLKKLGRESDINEDWGSGWESGPETKGIHFIENYKTGEKIVYWDEDKQGEYDSSGDWVGVKKKTLEEFFKWVDSLIENWDKDAKEWIAKCKKGKKLRYNQGNAFLGKFLATQLEATEVGKSKPPVAEKLIKKMGKPK
jgi:hypothetical protein